MLTFSALPYTYAILEMGENQRKLKKRNKESRQHLLMAIYIKLNDNKPF